MSTKDRILDAALTLARTQGVRNIRRDAVAVAADVAQGTVTFHYGDIDVLKVAVVNEAIRVGDVAVLRPVLFDPLPGMNSIPPELKTEILAS